MARAFIILAKVHSRPSQSRLLSCTRFCRYAAHLHDPSRPIAPPATHFLVTVAVIKPDGSATGWKTSAPPSCPSPLSSPKWERLTGLEDILSSEHNRTKRRPTCNVCWGVPWMLPKPPGKTSRLSAACYTALPEEVSDVSYQLDEESSLGHSPTRLSRIPPRCPSARTLPFSGNQVLLLSQAGCRLKVEYWVGGLSNTERLLR